MDGATYAVDNAGNCASRTPQPSGTASNLTYDSIYELTQVTQGSSTTESYSYDPVGNRLSSLGVSSYTNNSSNELTSTSSTTYTYDNNGNMATKVDSTGTTQYFWDYENRMTSVTLPGSGGTVTFKYDPFGRRIYKSSSSATSVYAYDGDNLIEETNSSGTVVARYAQGLSIDEPLAMLRSAATSYYHADGLGSVTSLSNTAGALANTYTYDSFGKLTASSGSLVNPFRFTARDFDTETNLQYSRNRYYDPNVGRFMSEDPTWQALASGNMYVYVDNDPTVAIDPSGLTSIFYDGKDIRVFDDSGKLLLKCRGTSGRPGRSPADQPVPYQGPLPRGSYWIDPSEISCVSGFRYWLRNKLGDWGHCRVVLHPFPNTNTYDRGKEGFFLHGGVTPGSAGCLDSGDCDTNIFKILNGSHGLVRVDVNYTQFQPF